MVTRGDPAGPRLGGEPRPSHQSLSGPALSLSSGLVDGAEELGKRPVTVGM
jgi:hypothetical protein